MKDFINWLEQNSSACVYKSLFGYECPGCGAQRSFILLLRGEFADSFAMYPALIPLIGLFLFIVAYFIFKFPKGTQVIKYGFVVVLSIIFSSYFYKLFTVGI